MTTTMTTIATIALSGVGGGGRWPVSGGGARWQWRCPVASGLWPATGWKTAEKAIVQDAIVVFTVIEC